MTDAGGEFTQDNEERDNAAPTSDGVSIAGDVPREHADELINAVLVNDQGVNEEDAQRVSDEVTEREYGAAVGSEFSEPTA